MLKILVVHLVSHYENNYKAKCVSYVMGLVISVVCYLQQ